MKVQWTKFIIVLALYLIFLYWVKSWLGLLVVPFIYDAYISKKINWQWWKDAEKPVRAVMSWVDAIVFALVAVYFINQFFFQNYVIPSSSLEKSLLTGDYLFVSKLSYGPRIPQTPLTMPLTQHTMPLFGTKSYFDWPHWDYRRVKGLGNVQLNDIVVFNYPAGDTIVSEPQYQTYYYDLVYENGEAIYKNNYPHPVDPKNLNAQQQHDYYDFIYAIGRNYVANNPNTFGHISSRPTDRRENYVKRCVGLPGQTLQIKNKIVYLDGVANKEPENVQYRYNVVFKENAQLTDELLKELAITGEDLGLTSMALGDLHKHGYVVLYSREVCTPLTYHAAEVLKQRTDLVESIQIINDFGSDDQLYPKNKVTGWTCDNYGPVWIPQKGKSIDLTVDNVAVYERPIKVYEGNDLKVKNGQVYINGQLAKSYTFKMDYYWMQGDNRHNSADSRYWGFVPEDHIVGKPIFIWWSSDPDRHGISGIRWSRLGKVVDNIK
ncbi:MAG: S26 family signal peptidase [Prevotella sp.]|nr:S26 family signal peptidase [Prevotella sp.]